MDADKNGQPLGILKNSSSFTTQLATSPEASTISPPALPADPAENKDLTLQNTLQNAGRRSSSARRTSAAGRRLSGTTLSGGQDDDRSSHLKWDEANMYLAEQEKTAKMKIDEPKTPWAPSYDPSQDDRDEMQIEAQVLTLDAHDLVVDELDKKSENGHGHSKKSVKDSEIPDFELGEPEENFHAAGPLAGESRIMRERSLSQNSNRSDKHVVVDNNRNDHLMTTEESEEKHREFEERRKKHYEMKNIKDLLA
jgi:protein phosphatase inhibitor 2